MTVPAEGGPAVTDGREERCPGNFKRFKGLAGILCVG